METRRSKTRLTAVVVWAAVAVVGLAGCSGSVSDVDKAKAQVTAKEKAVSDAQAAMTSASQAFCSASKDYISALDRYGDVLHSTAPTVGDVKTAGKDLAAPQGNALDGAEAALKAQQDLAAAQQDLAKAKARLAHAESGSTESPAPAEPAPSLTPLAPAASVNRVKQAEADFADAQKSISDQTSLKDASETFNAAVVALEMSWLKLYADAGCLTDAQAKQAATSVAAYTSALQQDLATAGFYTGPIDGIYGPMTVDAVRNLQQAANLPVTGTVDKATAAALQNDLVAKGDSAAQASVASTAALQQTLKLVGYWDGPVDGVWTPELTKALQSFQTALGVEPTGTVDAATVSAFEKAIADLKAGPTPAPSPSTTP
ncbi:peptidoglycan-binding domain-containing protein [Microbacterium sp. ASV49]|uniref:Peptidoglycan-binding domain-containing protein n=1 Tax=Microbacterium candidum TaxID=3041922 RepID=A0ABT7MVA6_9MICO|nr:peptidoglycan-binding domain-containing protein [Microbacterium sp. ASV49]MDL9978385.1 peptidoglycan-binding domain-containing protein [Microbacterium sp. ASV49]